MKKFIKENWFKIIISFSILLISISVSYFFVILPQKNIQEKQLSTNNNSNTWTASLPKEAMDKYGAEVLQTGGVGSRATQKTAYLLTEQGYLKPSEDWVLTSFNSPADIMDVTCKTGYAVTDCKVNGTETAIDSIFGCRAMPLENKMQNKVTIECNKK